MSGLDHEGANLSQRVKMGKSVSRIQQQPVREPRGLELEGQKSVVPPRQEIPFRVPDWAFWVWVERFVRRLLFTYKAVHFKDGITPSQEEVASFNCNKTPGYPKVCLKLIKICHTHGISALMPKLSSLSSFVSIFFITCRWQAGWPAICQLPSSITRWKSQHACAQACPTTEQLKLMTSEVFFNLMLLKQKQWLPGTRKRLKKLWRVMCIFIVLIVVRVCGHMHKTTYQNILFHYVNYTPIKLLKTVLTYFLLIIRFVDKKSMNTHLSPTLTTSIPGGNSVFLATQHLREAILLFPFMQIK